MELYFLSRNESKIGPDFIQKRPAVAVPYLMVISIAMAMGTVGNILVIGAVLVNKSLRTVGNIFIVNLAIADICVTAFVDPFSVVGIVLGEGWFDDKPVLCEIVASVCLTSCFCSLLSIGSISFNRYIAIVHNAKYQTIYTPTNTILMCVGLWTISFLAEMPNFFGWGDHVFDQKTISCVWDRTADFSYTLFFVSVGIVFPVILISICYIKIFLHVRNSKNKVHAGPGGAHTEKTEKEDKEMMKLVRTLCLIFVVFAVCWTPYAFVVALDTQDTYPQELHIFTIVIAHTNSSLNSIIYGVTNQHFRRGYMRLLGIDRLFSWYHKKYPKKVSPENSRADQETKVTSVNGQSSKY